MSVTNYKKTDKDTNTLVQNAFFDLWSAGTSSAPDNFTFSGGTGAAIAREGTTLETNYYASKVTSPTGGAAAKLYQDISTQRFPITYLKNKIVTVYARVNASVADKISVYVDDGTVNRSVYHTGGGTFEALKVQRKISSSATNVYIGIEGQVGGGVFYVDYIMAVETTKYPKLEVLEDIIVRKAASGANQNSKKITLVSDVAGTDKKIDILRNGTNDSFQITNNAGTVLKELYDSGIQDLPIQSMCRVSIGSNGSIPSGTVTLIGFGGAEQFDLQNEFNPTNARFTATKAGKYLVLCSLTYQQLQATTSYDILFYKNGSEYSRSGAISPTYTGYCKVMAGDIIPLSAADYIEVYTLHYSGFTETVVAGTNLTFLAICKVG